MARRRIKRVCILSEALQPHAIGVTAYEPFAISELGGTPAVGMTKTEFTVRLENIGGTGTKTHRLLLQWSGEKAFYGKPPGQETQMTELGTCAVACAVLWHYTGRWVKETTTRGQRFDYWLYDETRKFGMEVSGTQSSEPNEMQERHQQKRRQLLSYGSDGGYVVIVGFARKEIILSYHEPEEAA